MLKRFSVALLFTARGIPEEEGGKQLFQDVSNGARFGKELALDAIARDFNATDEFKDNHLGEEDALQKKLQQQMLAIPHFPVESIHDLMTQRQITALPNEIEVADVARKINVQVGLISKQLTLVGQLRDALDGARKKVKKKTTT